MLPKGVSEYLLAHRRRHLADLKELLRIASVANVPHPANQCRRCADWLSDRLRSMGLDSQVVETGGMPAVLARADVGPERPRLLIYGHYDVQPPDPLNEWNSDPFDPQVRDGFLYARGASDDKGQLFAHLMAIEAWLKADGALPVNLTVFLEGEEEIGSPALEGFMAAGADRLAADAAVVSDSGFFADNLPSVTYALRGLVYMELTVTGPRQDLHSGINGGMVTNPLNALASMVAAMHDDSGRVTIGGFYDDVAELTAAERAAWASLPFDAEAYALSLGLESLAGGEAGLDALERRWARPALDCHGIVGGYTAGGAKTVIPARATAKLSARLVAGQNPAKIVEGFRQFAADRAPRGVKANIDVLAEGRPVMLATDSAAMTAARDALAEAFGRSPAMVRCGASIPVVELIQRLLGLDAVLMGFGLPDDNLHGPNERLALKQLWGGSTAAASFYARLGQLSRRSE